MEKNEELLHELEDWLGLDPEDADEKRDRMLYRILNSVKARLKLLLGGIEPPQELNNIIIEVAIIRFNRIGSEGMDTHLVEGESTSYSNKDFEPFEDEIQSFLNSQKDSGRGKLRFL